LKRLKFRAHISRNRHGTRAFDECLLADFCEAEARSVLALSAHLTKLLVCVDAMHEACANNQLVVLVSDIDFWQYMTTPTAHAQRVIGSRIGLHDVGVEQDEIGNLHIASGPFAGAMIRPLSDGG